jgi:type I restriction enzyme S subunit
MESQELFIPGDKVMEKWHNLANSAFEKIMLNYEQIETLIQTREVLLPKLMSGKLRITS